MYLVNFGLPNGVTVSGVLASGSLHSTEFGALIGMDVICVGDFAITNGGGVTYCSFRIPPGTRIDYVSDWNKAMGRGLGRNDPCWCGARGPGGAPLKFKECHGK
jgi:hypothetical protein